MNFKFPIWTLVLAILCFIPIAYFKINWLAIIPGIYLLFAFIVLSISAIKKTFGKQK